MKVAMWCKFQIHYKTAHLCLMDYSINIILYNCYESHRKWFLSLEGLCMFEGLSSKCDARLLYMYMESNNIQSSTTFIVLFISQYMAYVEMITFFIARLTYLFHSYTITY